MRKLLRGLYGIIERATLRQQAAGAAKAFEHLTRQRIRAGLSQISMEELKLVKLPRKQRREMARHLRPHLVAGGAGMKRGTS